MTTIILINNLGIQLNYLSLLKAICYEMKLGIVPLLTLSISHIQLNHSYFWGQRWAWQDVHLGDLETLCLLWGSLGIDML